VRVESIHQPKFLKTEDLSMMRKVGFYMKERGNNHETNILPHTTIYKTTSSPSSKN
jgi:hypothetical protein